MIKIGLNSKKLITLIICLTGITLFISCDKDEDTGSIIKMSGSMLNGSQIKFFQLNSYDNALDLSGKIKLASGKIQIQIVSVESDEIFFTNEYSSNSTVEIHIANLNNRKELNMIVTGENAKKYSLNLQSKQKLILDKEKPEKPGE